MSGIKGLLKQYGVTLMELAEKLDLSRPTLTSYIETFEVDKNSLKDKYKLIFERLFPEKELDTKEFLAELDQCEELLLRDKIFGTSDKSPEETDMISDVIFKIRNAFEEVENKDYFSKFLKSLMANYKNVMVDSFMYYVLVMCGHLNLAEVSDESKKVIAKLFAIELLLENKKLELDEKAMDKLEHRLKEIEDAKQILEKEAQQMIKDGLTSKEIKLKDQTITIKLQND
jgi:DNA-binding CsgD family transcriptional regulator